MAITKIHPIKATLKEALRYVLEEGKTNRGLLVSSHACSPETADIEFGLTLSQCLEKGTNLAFHLMQSFKPGETSPETAHKIGTKLASGLLKDRYEYVLCTHVDKEHIHNHLIFCAANYYDHHKFISNRKSYYRIRTLSDLLCRRYGLSIVSPQSNRGNSYKEQIAKRQGTSWKIQIKRAIESALFGSVSYEEFVLKMHLLGVEVIDANKLTFRLIAEKNTIRAESLGFKYNLREIKGQIQSNTNQRSQIPFSPTQRFTRSISRRGKIPLHLRELKLSVETYNFLSDNKIDSIATLEKIVLEESLALRELSEKIASIEKTIRVKNARTHSSGNSDLTRKNNFSIITDGRGAYTDLADTIESNPLKRQVEGLYQTYYHKQLYRKQLLKVKKELERMLSRVGETKLVRSDDSFF